MIRVIDGEPLPVPSPSCEFRQSGRYRAAVHRDAVRLDGRRRLLPGHAGAAARLIGDRRHHRGADLAHSRVFSHSRIALGALGFVIGFIADLFAAMAPGTRSSRGGSWSSGSSWRRLEQRLVVQRQRRLQRRRWQFWRRRRLGELVAVMSIKRIARHLVQHHWRAKQIFPPSRARPHRAGDQAG